MKEALVEGYSEDENSDYVSQPGITYVVNKNTKKFHETYCDSVNEMKQKNRWDSTNTRDELIDMGYIPCKRCNP